MKLGELHSQRKPFVAEGSLMHRLLRPKAFVWHGSRNRGQPTEAGPTPTALGLALRVWQEGIP